MNLDDDAPTPTADESAPAKRKVTGFQGPFMAFPEECRPKIDHLIIEDSEPVDGTLIEMMTRLLTEPLHSSWAGPGQGRTFAVFAEVGLFWQPKQTPLVPDIMLSLDIPTGRERSQREICDRGYFTWVMGKLPNVVIEIVSDRHCGEDSYRMLAYAHVGVSYYVIFNPFEHLDGGVLRAFELCDRNYEPIDPRWLSGVGLGLTLWEGYYEGQHWNWLRWCDRDGEVIPTGIERAERELGQVREAEKRAEQAEQRAERLAAELRALGIDPSQPPPPTQ